LKVPGRVAKIESVANITLSVNGVLLSDVAAFLAKLSREKISIPAERAMKVLKVTLKATPLNKAITKLGLKYCDC
jgi:hypothetical protein